MPLLLPLLEWLLPIIALALCAFAYAFGAAITNSMQTGWKLFDQAIAWLTNRAIDFGIEFTKWLAPSFIENANRIVNYFHQLGQLAHYSAHFAWRTATTFSNYSLWLSHSYLPRLLHLHSDTTVAKATAVGRTQPFSAKQLRTLEHTIEGQVTKAIAGEIPTAIPLHWPKANWTVKRWRAWLGLAAGAGALTLPGSTAWNRSKWREQDKTNSQTHHRFRTLNWLLAFTGAAALVTAGLAKLGLGWMSGCKNLKKIGPAFCGADLAGLIGLFAGIVAIESGWSIVQLAEEMLYVEENVVSLITGAFSELDGIAP